MSLSFLDTEYIFLPDVAREAFANAPFEPLIKNSNILEASFRNFHQNYTLRHNDALQQSYLQFLENLIESFKNQKVD
jgi:hypothetical protein